MLSSGKLADANYQRIKYVTTSTTVTDAVACDDNANTEFHLLVKNGNSNKLFFKQFMLSSYYKIALLIIKSCMFFYGHILHFNLLHFWCRDQDHYRMLLFSVPMFCLDLLPWHSMKRLVWTTLVLWKSAMTTLWWLSTILLAPQK